MATGTRASMRLAVLRSSTTTAVPFLSFSTARLPTLTTFERFLITRPCCFSSPSASLARRARLSCVDSQAASSSAAPATISSGAQLTRTPR